MYLPNFLDGFDRLVAFDVETTGKRTPDAEFIRKQPFAWRAPGIIIEVGLVKCCAKAGPGARARLGAPGSTRMARSTLRPSRSTRCSCHYGMLQISVRRSLLPLMIAGAKAWLDTNAHDTGLVSGSVTASAGGFVTGSSAFHLMRRDASRRTGL
jgi:hypothetical protein